MKVDCYVQIRIVVLFQQTKQNDLFLKLLLFIANMIKFC